MGMRTRHVAIALAAVTAGLTATATLRRHAGDRPLATATIPGLPSFPSTPQEDAVVLPFARPVVAGPVAAQPGSPTRCADSGGRTKAGAPCGVRTTTGGRCHHHRVAA